MMKVKMDIINTIPSSVLYEIAGFLPFSTMMRFTHCCSKLLGHRLRGFLRHIDTSEVTGINDVDGFIVGLIRQNRLLTSLTSDRLYLNLPHTLTRLRIVSDTPIRRNWVKCLRRCTHLEEVYISVPFPCLHKIIGALKHCKKLRSLTLEQRGDEEPSIVEVMNGNLDNWVDGACYGRKSGELIGESLQHWPDLKTLKLSLDMDQEGIDAIVNCKPPCLNL